MLQNITHYVKTVVDTFWATVNKNWASFYYKHLVTLVRLTIKFLFCIVLGYQLVDETMGKIALTDN